MSQPNGRRHHLEKDTHSTGNDIKENVPCSAMESDIPSSRDNHVDRWQELEANPDLITASCIDLNNFFLKLPGGFSRICHAENKAFLNVLDQDEVQHDTYFDTFFNDVDAAILDAGFTATELKAMLASAPRNEEGMRPLHEKLVKVYLILRKKGYTHHQIIQ